MFGTRFLWTVDFIKIVSEPLNQSTSWIKSCFVFKSKYFNFMNIASQGLHLEIYSILFCIYSVIAC